jgi:hypothetical protein
MLNYQFTEKSKTDASYQFHERNKNTSPDGSVSLARPELREKSAVNKHQIIVDLTQRLRDIQNELESTRVQQKKTVRLLNFFFNLLCNLFNKLTAGRRTRSTEARIEPT